MEKKEILSVIKYDITDVRIPWGRTNSAIYILDVLSIFCSQKYHKEEIARIGWRMIAKNIIVRILRTPMIQHFIALCFIIHRISLLTTISWLGTHTYNLSTFCVSLMRSIDKVSFCFVGVQCLVTLVAVAIGGTHTNLSIQCERLILYDYCSFSKWRRYCSLTSSAFRWLL